MIKGISFSCSLPCWGRGQGPGHRRRGRGGWGGRGQKPEPGCSQGGRGPEPAARPDSPPKRTRSTWGRYQPDQKYTELESVASTAYIVQSETSINPSEASIDQSEAGFTWQKWWATMEAVTRDSGVAIVDSWGEELYPEVPEIKSRMTWGPEKAVQESQFLKPLKLSDTDHWLVAARHEEKALVAELSWLQLDKSHTKHAQIKFKSMKRDHSSRVMMVFTLNADESKEDLVMGGWLPALPCRLQCPHF